jgi:hypothetical protein
MSLWPTGNDENAFCGARLQACRVDSRVDVLPALTAIRFETQPYFQRSSQFWDCLLSRPESFFRGHCSEAAVAAAIFIDRGREIFF